MSRMESWLLLSLSILIFGIVDAVDAALNNDTYQVYSGLLVNTPLVTSKARNLRECSSLCSTMKYDSNSCRSATFVVGNSDCHLSNETVADTTNLNNANYKTVAGPTPSQTVPNKGNYTGTTFYTGFLHNSGTIELQMFFVSTALTNVNVVIPFLAIDETFIVNPTAYKVYASTLQHAVDMEQSNKGVYVQADSPITLYSSNNRTTTLDTTLVLPIGGIGTEYAVMTTPNTGENMFLIVGTADATTVNVTTGANTTQYTLNRMGTFCRKTTGLDGTVVKADKPIAMLSGSSCTVIVGGGCDHVSEVLPPVTSFGTDFIVGHMYPRHAYTLGVMAMTAGTTVDVLLEDGSPYTSFLLGVGQIHYEQYLNNITVSLSSNYPIMVMQYGHGGGELYVPYGDPSMMLVVPLDRFGEIYEVLVPAGSVVMNVFEIVVDDEVNIRINEAQVQCEYVTSVFTANKGVYRLAYVYVQPGLYTIRHVLGASIGVSWYGGQSYGEFAVSLGWV